MKRKNLLQGLAVISATAFLALASSVYAGRHGSDNPFMPQAPIPGIDNDDEMDDKGVEVNDNDNDNDNDVNDDDGASPTPSTSASANASNGSSVGASPSATPDDRRGHHQNRRGRKGPGH